MAVKEGNLTLIQNFTVLCAWKILKTQQQSFYGPVNIFVLKDPALVAGLVGESIPHA
jgi:hypothetical protein